MNKKREKSPVFGKDDQQAISAPCRIRTCDPLLRRQLLYPLS